MHVKYASRHALYPVSNVWVDGVVDARAIVGIIALRPARADVCATFLDAVVTAARAFVAARVTVVALRATVVVAVARALVRGIVPVIFVRVAVRPADGVIVAVRGDAVAVRVDTVGVDVVTARIPTVWGLIVLRAIVDASRTAASAIPMQPIHAMAKSKILFIPFIMYIMISKRPRSGQGINYMFVHKNIPPDAGYKISCRFRIPWWGGCVQRM